MTDAVSKQSISISSEAPFSLQKIPLEERAIAPSILNIESKERSNIYPWNGQFSPQFVEAILTHYTRPGMKVHDPFCGSGTVLCEAGRLNLSASGSEVNPAAFLLARTYSLMNVPIDERTKLAAALEQSLIQIVGSNFAL